LRDDFAVALKLFTRARRHEALLGRHAVPIVGALLSPKARNRPAMIDETRNPWTIHDTESRYDNPWIRVTESQITHPSGRPGIYGVVHFKNLAVGVIPVDSEGCTWLVGQYRFPLGRYSWEIPEGGCPLGTPPEATAHRELAEETGLAARHLVELQRMDLSNSTTDESAVLYAAWEISHGTAAPEDSEQLQVRRLPLGRVFEMVAAGEITDAMSIAALLKLRLMALDGALPPDLAACVRRGTGGR
jgi:8-oxo-dGTP pyrophosphatase MutT (NUDIX family)